MVIQVFLAVITGVVYFDGIRSDQRKERDDAVRLVVEDPSPVVGTRRKDIT